MILGILKGFGDHHQNYIDACRELDVEYEVIDLLSSSYINDIVDSKAQGFLCHPPCKIPEQKNIYDERLFFINKVLGKPIYPSYEELYVYENKRNLSDLLKVLDVPHAKTNVFCRKQDAIDFVEKATYPLVFKSKIGAASSGVDIVKNSRQAKKLINKSFGRLHPLFTYGHLRCTKKYGIPIPTPGTLQRHYVIIQEYHPIKWEWRIIKIDNTFAGRQKLLNGKFASGSLQVGWKKPPIELLRLVKNIAHQRNYYSIAVDIFETKDGKFLVNEIQSMFGAEFPFEMLINDVAGMFVYNDKDDTFEFVKGVYHQYNSKSLRIKHFIKLLNQMKDTCSEN